MNIYRWFICPWMRHKVWKKKYIGKLYIITHTIENPFMHRIQSLATWNSSLRSLSTLVFLTKVNPTIMSFLSDLLSWWNGQIQSTKYGWQWSLDNQNCNLTCINNSVYQSYQIENNQNKYFETTSAFLTHNPEIALLLSFMWTLVFYHLLLGQRSPSIIPPLWWFSKNTIAKL